MNHKASILPSALNEEVSNTGRALSFIELRSSIWSKKAADFGWSALVFNAAVHCSILEWLFPVALLIFLFWGSCDLKWSFSFCAIGFWIFSHFQPSIADAHSLNKRTKCVSGHGKATNKRGSDKKLGPLVLPHIRCVLCSNGVLDRKQTKLNFALHANFRLAWLLDFPLICTALTCNCDRWVRAADNLQAAAWTRRTSCVPRPCKALSTRCFVTRQWFANLGSLIASVDAKRDLDCVVLSFCFV